MAENWKKSIAEASCVRKAVLDNGLTVLVREMPGFDGVHAVYSTKFGSIDRAFELDGRRWDLPAGIAHFLEHKMFENEDGDAFALYAKTGANANAYTGFDRTSYVFTATSRVPENLDILLSFVSRPYFTKETIEKEQGIIGQEIKMYDDSPEWRLVFGIYQNLYQNHGIGEDIAGSTQSIAEITPEMLYACTDAFYRPQNMVLAVAGNVTLEMVLDACARADIPSRTAPVKRLVCEEPAGVKMHESEIRMAVAKPLVGLGFKETPIAETDIRAALICDILPELVCGGTTPLYRRLYDEGLISPDFSSEALSVAGATCILFGGETPEPEKVRDMLLEEIARLRREGIDRELFRLCKNAMYGDLVRGLENIEESASGMASMFFRGCTVEDEAAALAALRPEDVEEALRTMLLEEHASTVIIRPV